MHVRASEWKECLACISELCGTKWITEHKTHGNGTRIIYSESFNCHHAGSYTPWREVRTGQKDTKKQNTYLPPDLRLGASCSPPKTFNFIQCQVCVMEIEISRYRRERKKKK